MKDFQQHQVRQQEESEMTIQAKAFDTTETDRPVPEGDQAQRTALHRSLEATGTHLSPYAFEIAVARVKTAERSGPISQAQINSIVDDVISSTEILQGVADSFR